MHVMIDLETMGTRPNAPIIAIGAVAFDATSILREFYVNVYLGSSVTQGKAVISPETVMWWMKQSDEARAAFNTDNAYSLEGALSELKVWLDWGKVDGVWGNGATFDNVILREAFNNVGVLCPWPFWKDKCYRTVKGAYPDVTITRDGTHHNALDDAIYQAQHLVAINQAAGGALI